jgi:hypothetical protein
MVTLERRDTAAHTARVAKARRNLRDVRENRVRRSWCGVAQEQFECVRAPIVDAAILLFAVVIELVCCWHLMNSC